MSEQFTVDVAGHALCVTCHPDAHVMRKAFAPIEVARAQGVAASLKISVVPEPLSEPRFAGLGVGVHRTPDGRSMYAVGSPTNVQALSRTGSGAAERVELELVLSPEAATSGDMIAHPAHSAMYAWMATQGKTAMHAAGVCLGDSGLLLVGDGGHGKTTTALAACQRGFSYLGDDVCIVELDAGHSRAHRMHGLYGTAKLNTDSRGRLGAGGWPVIGTTPKGKAVVSVTPHLQWARSAPVSAIVHVGHAGTGPAKVGRLSQQDAWKALARASVPALGVEGTTRDWLRTIMSLARDVPVFGVQLDWDLDRSIAMLERFAMGREP
jgi:hypothetical protein